MFTAAKVNYKLDRELMDLEPIYKKDTPPTINTVTIQIVLVPRVWPLPSHATLVYLPYNTNPYIFSQRILLNYASNLKELVQLVAI